MQVINSLALQPLHLFSTLDIEKQNVHEKAECYKQPLSEEELGLIDLSFNNVSNLDEHERAALYYIAGYVAYKEEGLSRDNNDNDISCKESEFLDLVSRGKLKYPSEEFFDLCLYLFSFYKDIGAKMCCTRLILSFNLIHDFTGYEIINRHRVFRRLGNCFSKALAKKMSDQVILENKKEQTIEKEENQQLFLSKLVLLETIKC